MKRICVLLCGVILCLFLGSLNSPAAVRTWTNVLGGSWSTPANWSPNIVPGPVDTANLTNSGTYTVTISSGPVALANLNLGGASGTQTLVNSATSTLLVTNQATIRANGVLSFTAGGFGGRFTIQNGGKLELNSSGGLSMYSLNLVNQGTVTWISGSLNGGATPTTVISNGGVWEITGNNTFNQGIGGPPMVWTNTGTLRKSGGTGTSQINGFSMHNTASGLIEVKTGTLQLPNAYSHAAGVMRVDGGSLRSSGTLGMTGGTLEGVGTIGANSFSGGVVGPGLAGSAGLIGFSSGLNLSAGAVLNVGGTGLMPGIQYDQLSVTGGVALANATLQVSSLPAVPPGTTFVIIANDGNDPVTGTFNGLADNALINVSGQPFRVRYAGGTGNDVVLVRDGGVAGAQLSSGGYTNGNFRLLGVGTGPVVHLVEASTNLVHWTTIGSVTGNAGGNFVFIDTNAFRFRYRFYRTR